MLSFNQVKRGGTMFQRLLNALGLIKKEFPPEQEGEVVLNLSEFNDRWNKMALGITDADVPSRPKGGSS
jgi:hypothetical protein